MDTLSMCRICLVEDVTMHCLINTKLQDIYEKLTAMPFDTDDGRPLSVCYVCSARLNSCYRLQISCVRSEEWFNEMLANHQLKPIPLQNMVSLKLVHPLIQLSCVPVTVEGTNQQRSGDEQDTNNMRGIEMENNIIKEEFLEVTQDNILDQEPSILYKEPADNSWIKIEDDELNGMIAENINGDERSTVNIEAEENIKVKEYKNINMIKRRHLKSNSTMSGIKSNLCLKPVKIALKIDMRQLERSELTNQQPKLAVEFEKIHTKISKQYEAPFQNHIKFTSVMKTEDQYIQTRKKKDRKTYKCDLCEKCFTQKGHLLDHTRIHTGERPYKCDMCEKCFSQKSHLLVHIPTHSGVKPYKCDTCEKSFKRKTNLTQHVRVHKHEKPYKRDICEKYFNLTTFSATCPYTQQ